VLDSQLLTQRPDLGAARGVLRHDPTVPGGADTSGPTHGNHAQSRVHPQSTAASAPRSNRSTPKYPPAQWVMDGARACHRLIWFMNGDF
jgi:hypothetical protein